MVWGLQDTQEELFLGAQGSGQMRGLLGDGPGDTGRGAAVSRGAGTGAAGELGPGRHTGAVKGSYRPGRHGDTDCASLGDRLAGAECRRIQQMLGSRKAWAGWVEVPRAEQREGSRKTPGVPTGQLSAIGQDRDPSEERALGQVVFGRLRGGLDGAQTRPRTICPREPAHLVRKGCHPPSVGRGPARRTLPHDGLLSSAGSGREQSPSLFYRRGN